MNRRGTFPTLVAAEDADQEQSEVGNGETGFYAVASLSRKAI